MASHRILRRSYFTTTELNSLVGRLGEICVDSTKKTAVVFDGSTLGGIPLAKETHTHPIATNSVDGFISKEDRAYIYSHTHPAATTTVSGFMSATDKLKLDSIDPGGGTAPYPYSSTNVPSSIVLRDGNGDFAARWITATKFIGSLQGNATTVTNGIYTSSFYTNPTWLVSVDANKLFGTIPATVSYSGTILWTNVVGRPTSLSQFVNDTAFINSSSNISGTSAGVNSLGGRETPNPNGQTVILRDAAGRAQVVAPVSANDIATKAYVDANSSGGSYKHVATVLNNSLGSASGGIPFNATMLDLTEAGYMQRVGFTFNSSGPTISSSSTSGLNLYITIDDQAEVSLGNIIGVLTFNTVFPVGLSTAVDFMWDIDLVYKTKLKIRIAGTMASFPGNLSISTSYQKLVKF